MKPERKNLYPWNAESRTRSNPDNDPSHVSLSDLMMVMERLERTCTDKIDRIRIEFEEHIAIIRKESEAWRASSENEFCRLISNCTRHLTTLQERYQRSVRHEAFLSQRLAKMTKEKFELENKIKTLLEEARQVQPEEPNQ